MTNCHSLLMAFTTISKTTELKWNFQFTFFWHFKLMLESLVPHFILKIYELKILLFCAKIFRVFLWGFPALTLIPSMHKEKWTKKGTQRRDNDTTMRKWRVTMWRRCDDATLMWRPCDDDATMIRWCNNDVTTMWWCDDDETVMWRPCDDSATTQRWCDDLTSFVSARNVTISFRLLCKVFNKNVQQIKRILWCCKDSFCVAEHLGDYKKLMCLNGKSFLTVCCCCWLPIRLFCRVF